MASAENTASTSCISCAKRKVKCDRRIPCSRCTQRSEACEYPVGDGSIKGQTAQSLVKSQQYRIAELEAYIKQSGNNVPVEGSIERREDGNGGTVAASVSDAHTSAAASTRKRARPTLEEHEVPSRPRHGPEGGLVEHDEQTAYIEAPIWFSWDETKEKENVHPRHPHACRARDNADDNPTGYYHTVLQAAGRPKTYLDLPANVSRHLWQAFVENVHPLTKIFFDWAKAAVMEKAATNPGSLAPGQRAFISSVHFLATLSLSDEECREIFNRQTSTKYDILLELQYCVETALMDAKYTSTGELQVLQALTMYIVSSLCFSDWDAADEIQLAMRNRARPAECFSLMGVAVRIAQRLGIHRDGAELGLPPYKAEEARRTWWQMQYLEIMISQLLGCISVTLYCDWDAKQPSNLDDADVSPDMEVLPPSKPGLTSTSYCSWGYDVPHLQRQNWNPTNGAIWGSSSRLSLEKKRMMMDGLRKLFSEKYLQYCELIDPLHVQIQIGLNSALLALQRAILQPTVGVSRLSEMPMSDREELLKICRKAMDYFILTMTNSSLAGFKWLNECWFQWTAFVYILVETERRATSPEAAGLWDLIDSVCKLHPKITTHTARPDVSAVGRLTLCAWQKRAEYLLEKGQPVIKPCCVETYEKAYHTGTNSTQSDAPLLDSLDDSFDFDLIDWSSWNTGDFWPEPLGGDGIP